MYDDDRGFVVNLSKPYARRAEVSKWADHAWWAELWRLDVRLAKIDPHYTLIQFKEKFGSPRFYFSTESNRRQEMRQMVDEAMNNMFEAERRAERQKAIFDRYAVPPNPWNDDFTPVKF